jgi:2-dehydro-3-deoxyphosphogluconate aldolase / (4S)-4-hydroxy-2-oxoglutarate aldolase
VSELDAIRRAGVVAVLRAPSAEAGVLAAEALLAGGVTGIEVTYSTPDVPSVLATLADRHGDRMVLGAGTLLAPAQAAPAVEAGASFLVSPGVDDEVIASMRTTGAAVLAGALTPTEVMRAMRLGVHAVKVFPGSLVGPGYLRALRGPFPDVPLVPTGGVAADNLADWLAAGALAVGAGGELAPAAAIAEGRWDELTERAKRFTAALAAARPAP